MLKNQNIICISSIDWDFVWQGHQEIMSTFARNNNKVLFIENTGVRTPRIRDIPRIKARMKNWLKGIKGIRKELDNLYVFSPIVLPFPYSWIARKVNRRLILPALERWMRVMDFDNPVIWTFLPTGISLDIIDNLTKKAAIYYCIAEFADLAEYPKKIKKTERELLKRCDLVFVQGEELKRHCQTYNCNVSVFPFGVKLEVFKNFTQERCNQEPDDLKNIKNPVIGYIGGLHKHLDYNLIASLARDNPEWSLVFIGPVQSDVSCLREFKNIHILGQKNHQELPRYINRFSVSIIPYVLSNYTRTVYPTKLNEYLIMAKPVVSTELPEINSFNRRYGDIVYLAKTDHEFSQHIQKAIKEDSTELKKRRMDIAEENSWENRIEKMSALIEEAIATRRLDREARWKENLISFYRVARRKLLRFGAICLLAYLLLFKTPLIWFLAEPLKIIDAPQRADAIVVFAGGVGESGQAGQGYAERVKRAVDLYKQGYASYMIFSTGYIYAFQEAEVMKALAVSLGVPPDAILLEEKAANTYENVKSTKQILDNQGWDSILLISSSYHMRRVALVFKRIAKGLKVTYTPVLQGRFYRHENNASLRQIHGIMHEYLGIIYYLYKGYI